MQTIYTSVGAKELPRHLADMLPPRLCAGIRRCSAPTVEEIRMHSDRYTTVTARGQNYGTDVILTEQEMKETLTRMCKGSLYAYGETINQGYLTLDGGIRVGVCGSAAVEKGTVIGVGNITGLMIRIPHVHAVSGKEILERFCKNSHTGGVLIYAPPGVGKTTLLRAIAADAASPAYGYRTVVVDNRGELRFSLSGSDLTLDILHGYPREVGIEIAVRSLGAGLIICDEIGSDADAKAILSAANCGVPLIASAHAFDVREMLSRPAIQILHRAHVFGLYVGISRHADGFSYRFTDWNAVELRDPVRAEGGHDA